MKKQMGRAAGETIPASPHRKKVSAVIAGIVCLTMGLIFSANVHAIHTCIDKDGKKTFQEQPCKDEPVSIPARGDIPSTNEAQEAVQRFNTAMNERNPAVIKRLITNTFVGEIHEYRGDQLSRTSFNVESILAKMNEPPPRIRKYSTMGSCIPDPEIQKTLKAMVLRCSFSVTTEVPTTQNVNTWRAKKRYPERNNISQPPSERSEEIFRVVSSKGEARIDGITSHRYSPTYGSAYRQ